MGRARRRKESVSARTRTHIYTPATHILNIVWAYGESTCGIQITSSCAHILMQTLVEYELVSLRTHARTRTHCMLPTPACVNLPAFLANLQHNGTPVSSNSPLPPQKHSHSSRGSREGGALNIFINKHLNLFSNSLFSLCIYLQPSLS